MHFLECCPFRSRALVASLFRCPLTGRGVQATPGALLKAIEAGLRRRMWVALADHEAAGYAAILTALTDYPAEAEAYAETMLRQRPVKVKSQKVRLTLAL